MKKPNIFQQLRKPKSSRIDEIDAELAGCQQVIRKYGESLAEIRSHLAEIESYMREISQERERLTGDSK
ncbi:MAG: hypothetical protein ACLPVO_09435 [Desulfomonilaceae bacterium]